MTRGTLIVDHLRSAGLITGRSVNDKKVATMSLTDIVDLAQEALELSSSTQQSREDRPYCQTASLSLSAGRWPCSAFRCRRSRLLHAAQFAALFSDRLYVHNLLGDYARHAYSEGTPNVDHIRRGLSEDLRLFVVIEPLITSGLVEPLSLPLYCPRCLSPRAYLSADKNKALDGAFRRLRKRYSTETSISLSYTKGAYIVETRGPAELVHDGFLGCDSKEPPPNLDQRPRILARVRGGTTTQLSRSVISLIRFDAHLADMAIRNILYELACAQCLGTGYLSDNPLDYQIIKSVTAEEEEDRTDALLEELTSEIPFLDELSPVDILSARNKAPEAFTVFRDALRRAVREWAADKSRMSTRRVKALYADLVEPELGKLDTQLKIARRTSLKGAARRAAGWTAAVGVAAYAGWLPPTLAVAAGALGFTKVLADLFAEGLASLGKNEHLRNENMYFLWTLRRKTR